MQGATMMTAEETRMLKHELRTPINHIIGYSELLLEAAADEGEDGVSERARTVHENGQALASLIDRHLAAFKEAALGAASKSLRVSVTPVIAAIIENAEPEPDDEAMWSQDFRRIQAAAQKLITVLEHQEERIS